MSSTADPRAVNLAPPAPSGGVSVNDLHSRLNPTVVDRIVDVRSAADARAAILAAAAEGKVICVSGGRHSMGGQQFAQVFARNPASARVLQKIGMTHEGTLRHHVKKWDEFVDVECYGIVR